MLINFQTVTQECRAILEESSRYVESVIIFYAYFPLFLTKR